MRTLTRARTGLLGLLRDLQELRAIAGSVAMTCAQIRRAVTGLDGSRMVEVVAICRNEAQSQRDWLGTALDKSAPQALVVG